MKLTNVDTVPFYKRKSFFWGLLAVVVVCIIIAVTFGKPNNTAANPKQDISKQEPTMSESFYKKECESIDYETLARNPDKYKGNKYVLTGKVIQVDESSYSDNVDLRINITKNTNKYTDDVSWSDTIYATVEIPKGSDRILKNDVITFWGVCDGMYTYTSVLGSSVSLPKIDIEYYEIKNDK